MVHHPIRYTLPRELEGSVLAQIMRARLQELAVSVAKYPAASIAAVLDRAPAVRSLRAALVRRSPAVIAEVKKASPSAGTIREDADPVAIGVELETAGAAALSVVTEGLFFRGNLENLARLRWMSRCPLLRKDFIVHPYQVLEARHAGADAVLLIAALLDAAAMRRLREEAEAIGMDALVEVHDKGELDRALGSGATLIGVNNRDLRTFRVSLDVSFALAGRIPKEAVAVSESGIRSAEDIRRLMDAGYRGFLVGEQLMRAASPGRALSDLLRK